MKIRTQLILVLVFVMSWSTSLNAQLGGSRAGREHNSRGVVRLATLSREVAEGFIAIEGRAEVRVRPTEIRVVLAITSEAATAGECQRSIKLQIDKLRSDWLKLKIPADAIVEDFIAVLPMYQWELEKKGDVDIGVEKKSGFRMQTNLHLEVPNDPTVNAALAAAFDQGITDIIAFDYWSKELDEFKVKARQQALEAANKKGEFLLGALFKQRPPAINIQEQTTVRFPESLYYSFENSYSGNVTPTWRRDVPFIRAFRPQNTYYRGLSSDSDVQPQELPMKPEISVVSTVRLYYQSPAAERENDK